MPETANGNLALKFGIHCRQMAARQLRNRNSEPIRQGFKRLKARLRLTALQPQTMRLMSSLLYHVSPMDPRTYVRATLSIIAITWIAMYVPSRRAAIVDPVHAVRAE